MAMKDEFKDMAKTYVAVRGAMHHSDKKRKIESDALKEDLRKEREEHKRQIEELKQEQRILQKKSEVAMLLSSTVGQKELRKKYLGIINSLKSSVAPTHERIEILASRRVSYNGSEIFEYTSQHLSEFLRKNPEIADAVKIRDRFYIPEKKISANSVLEDVYKPYAKLLSLFKVEQKSKKMVEEFNQEANEFIHDYLIANESPDMGLFEQSDLKVDKKNIALAKKKIDYKKIFVRPFTIIMWILILFFVYFQIAFMVIILLLIWAYKIWSRLSKLSKFKNKLLERA